MAGADTAGAAGGSPATDARAAVLALHGDLAAGSIASIDKITAALTANRIAVLVLDLAQAPRCDPAGLAAALRLAGKLTQDQMSLRPANAQPIVWMACYLDDRTVTIPVYYSVRTAALGDPEPHPTTRRET